MHMRPDFLSAVLKVMRNPHFWFIVVMLAIGTILHYPQQLLFGTSVPLLSGLELKRHAVERVFALVPIAYASFIFGTKGGIAIIIAASAIMLPRAIFISVSPSDALFESSGIILSGVIINFCFHWYRQERERLRRLMLKLDKAIAKQIKTGETLRESEKSFRNLFENAIDAIWVHDLDGNIVMANEASAKLTGYPIDELYGRNVKSFLSDESLNLAREIGRKLIQQESITLPYEQRLIRKDGTEVICTIATNLIISNGKPSAFQNMARDVTDERRMHEIRYYLKEITKAQEEERKSIARELHDSTAQTLIALLHQLENLLVDKIKLPVREAKSLWSFHEQIRDALQEVRSFSRDLRPSILDDLGLFPALEWVTEEIQREYGVKISLKVVGSERRLTQETELLLFRIVQEALRNTAKHAQASMAKVEVESDENKIKVTITDNGIGFRPPKNLGTLPYKGKLGLVGMQERVQLLGGSLKLNSKLGNGTTIIVNAPV